MLLLLLYYFFSNAYSRNLFKQPIQTTYSKNLFKSRGAEAGPLALEQQERQRAGPHKQMNIIQKRHKYKYNEYNTIKYHTKTTKSKPINKNDSVRVPSESGRMIYVRRQTHTYIYIYIYYTHYVYIYIYAIYFLYVLLSLLLLLMYVCMYVM